MRSPCFIMKFDIYRAGWDLSSSEFKSLLGHSVIPPHVYVEEVVSASFSALSFSSSSH